MIEPRRLSPPRPPARKRAKPSAHAFFAGGGEMGQRIRDHDWSKTPLGPIAHWPQSLKTVVRIMLDSRYAMWMGWGKNLTFFYNDAYARDTLGKKHPWALARPASDVWAEIWPDIGPRIQRVLRTGEATWDEGLLLFLERSGYPEETYHTFSYSPLYDDHGDMGGMLCVVTEETKRVIAERRVAMLRDLASALTSARTEHDVFDALERCLKNDSRDLPFTLTFLSDPSSGNLRLAACTGLDRSHPAAASNGEAAWPLREVLENNTPLSVSNLAERIPPLPTGPWPNPPQETLLVPIAQQGQSDPAGVFVAALNPHRSLDQDYRAFINLFVGQIATAIANARAAESERRRAEALAELDRAKTTFFSNISHELRTPLTLMLGPIEDVLRKPDSQVLPDNRELMTVAHRNALRLLKLVNTLLDFSRIEAGRIQALYEPLDLAAYTADLASLFRSAIETAGLTLTLDCPRLPEPVFVDREMWEKVVLNLLSNAFKFTFEGGITVALRWCHDEVKLSITDTGVGIPPSELPRLFERFYRVRGARSRSHEGTGIGLALVQELARLHGGTVQVESREAVGTTFTVSIKTGAAHLPADRVRRSTEPASTRVSATPFVQEALRWLPDAPDTPPAGTAQLAPLSPSLQSQRSPPGAPRILIADDNADMRDYVRRLLVGQYAIETVPDGEAALESILSDPPDLVLTDVMMPRRNGFELLSALRANPKTRAIPVIMLSARAGEEARVDGLDAGADDYLIKPFSARELQARVGSQLEITRLRREREEEVTRILQSITDGFQALDANWRFTYMNAAARRMLEAQGLNPQHLIGKHFFDDVFPQTRGTELEPQYRRAMNERVPVQFEYFYEPWQRWYLARAYPVLQGGITIYFSDITEQKRGQDSVRLANERLAAERRLYHAILSTTPDLAYIFDLNYRFIYANDALLTMWNKTWDEAIGKNCLELGYEPWHAEMHDREIEQVIATKQSVRGEVPFTGMHGRRIYDYIFVPVIGADGMVEAVAGTTRDVTEHKQTAEKLEQMVGERTASLREAVEQMEEFSYSVSHDLRAPLRAITAYAGVLLEEYSERLDDTGRHYLEKIRRSGDRMDRLTQDVLLYSRVARAHVQVEPISLEHVINDIIHQYAHLQPPAAQIDITGPLLDVLGHETTLGQCVANLLTNAVKFVAPDVKPYVRISTERRGKDVRVCFQDNGIGIKPEHQRRVFQMFERVHPEGNYEGTGIGLTIVRKAVEKMGGTVGVESDGRNGSRFWLKLRAADA
jgi:PAS domain S-box-containing protein